MSKTIVYQMLPRLWGSRRGGNKRNGSLSENGCGHFSDIDSPTLSYLRDLGVTHLWLTGVVRHATTESFEGCPASNPAIVKGRAGSPYAIVDYYDVNPYLADNQAERMDEFKALVGRVHSSGLKLLIDFVPNHLSRDYGKVGLVRPEAGPFGADDDSSAHWKPENDFFYYPGESLVLPSGAPNCSTPYFELPAKASGNCFSPTPGQTDWYETVRLNYCDFHTRTWDKMLDIVLYWAGLGVDGFRCDMVEMVPPQFFKWLISNVKETFPEAIFVAEVYQKERYAEYADEVGFDLLYDKSGTYDEIRALVQGRGSAERLSANWQFLGHLQPRMLNFLENHDEQRFASDFFGSIADNSAAALAFSLLFNDSAFLLYCGQEVGERGMDEEGFSGLDGRTTIFDWWSPAGVERLCRHIRTGGGLESRERKTLEEYSSFLNMSTRIPAFSDGGTFDLCYCNKSSEGFDPHKHFVFLRGRGEDIHLCVCNFSDREASMTIEIPPQAFAHFRAKKDLDSRQRVEVSVKAQGCAIVRI